MTASAPNVFAYQDVLQFLKDAYKFRKHSAPGFSYETWAQEMGLRSRSYLRAIVIGEKRLQENVLPNLIAGFKFTDEEVSYFILLVRAHVAPTPQLKNLYLKELFLAWKVKAQTSTVGSPEEFLSDSLIPALFTYLSFEDHSSDVTTIAKDFACDEQRIQGALRSLIWNRLIDGSVTTDGVVQYRTITPFFQIPSSPANTHLKKFHVEGLRLSQEAAHLPSHLRKIYSTFVALDEGQFKNVQSLIEDFNNKLLSVLEDKSVRQKKIYRLNQQLFPVSETIK